MKQETTYSSGEYGPQQPQQPGGKPREGWFNINSHLDYSWYRRRASSRVREAELLDGVVGVVGSGRLPGFTLEQTVAGREYVEVLRRDKKEPFLHLIREKKIELIGTEIQQEIFLSGEEGFFWNVEIGHDMARELGSEPSKALYIPDTFGFPDSMAKMARAAGYNNLIYSRGMGDEVKTLGGLFNLTADDGSEIIAIPMPDGYGSANKLGRWDTIDNKHVNLRDQPEKWNDAAVKNLKRMLSKYGDRYTQIGLPLMLFGAGSDFEEIDVDLPSILEHCERAFQAEKSEFSYRFTSLEGYVDAVQEHIDPADLNSYSSELRSSAEHPVLRGIESVRMPIKLASEKADREIMKADTLLALSILCGNTDTTPHYEHDTGLLQATMYDTKRIILPVWSHDAISGCCTDDVPSDLLSRLDDVWDYASQVKRNSMANLAGRKDIYSNKLRFDTEASVVNTQPYKRQGTVEIPLRYSLPNAEHLIAETPDGEVPVQVIEKNGKKFAAASVQVEGYGATHVALKEAEAPVPQSEEKKRQNEAENKFYNVKVMENGVVQVKSKETGVITYAHMFEDQADRGDEYNFDAVEGEEPITTEKSKAKVTVINDGPVLTEMQIDMSLPLPIELNKNRDGRSEEMVPARISTVMRLAQGVDRVDFTTTLTNMAKDHRFRVLFKTPKSGDTVRAKEAYGMTERIAVPIPGGEDWTEPLPVATSHNQGLVAAGDVAIFNRGIPEYEAFESKDGNIDGVALTLLRSVGWLSRFDLKSRPFGAGPNLEVPDAQCIGTHTFEYSMSMRGQESNADLIRRMNDYRFDLEAGLPGVKLTDVLQVTGEGFEVSALKPLRDGEGAMLRVYNPNKTASTINVAGMFTNARRADAIWGKPLDEEDASSTTLRPGEILTLRLE